MFDLPFTAPSDANTFRFHAKLGRPHACCAADEDPTFEGGAGQIRGPGQGNSNGDELDVQQDVAVSGNDDDRHDWRSECLREVVQSRKYRQRAQRAEGDLEELRARALSTEQYAEYVSLRDSANELADKDKRIVVLEGMVRQVVGANELSKALVACGVGRGLSHGDRMLAQAAALLAGRVNVVISGAEPAVRVLGPAGKLVQGPDGKPVSVHDFVAQWLAEEGSHFLPASGDTGSGAHKGPTAGGGVSIEHLDHDPKAKAEFIAKHGPQAYVQLARKKR